MDTVGKRFSLELEMLTIQLTKRGFDKEWEELEYRGIMEESWRRGMSRTLWKSGKATQAETRSLWMASVSSSEKPS